MRNARTEFENALLVDRVANRFAIDFSSESAWLAYKAKHPEAEKSKHRVRANPKEDEPQKLEDERRRREFENT